MKVKDEIKILKKELKGWKSQDVKERFERVNSKLHLVTINELEHKIKRLALTLTTAQTQLKIYG